MRIFSPDPLLRGLLALTVCWCSMRPVWAQEPDRDSLISVWKDANATEDDRGKALSLLLYADTVPGALGRAWERLGRAASDTSGRLWERARACEAMTNARRLGKKDDHAAAARWFALAAERYETLGHQRFATEAHRWSGFAFNNIGRFAEAAPHLLLAERGYRSIGDSSGITDVCCSLGYAFLMQENYALAKEQFLRGLDHARGRDSYWEFTMLYKIAECEFDAKHIDTSIVFLERARALLVLDSTLDAVSAIPGLEGDLALQAGRCGEALKLYRQRLREQVARGFGDDHLSSDHSSIAEALACAGRHAEALAEAREALRLAEHGGLLELQERALRIMAQALEAMHRLAEALDCQKRMITVRDSLEQHESLSVLSSSLERMRLEDRLRVDSLSAVLARSTARASDIEHRRQRVNLIALIGFIIFFAGVLFANARIRRRIQLEGLRTRLSRDLHDDIGSTLSSINILSTVARRKAEAGDEAGAAASLSGISERTQRLMRNMSDIVWSVDPAQDSMADLLARMREFGAAVLEPKGIGFRFVGGEDLPVALSAEMKSNLYLIYKEALNNAAKHANASQVEVAITRREGSLRMMITDNGNGMTGEGATLQGGGNGLRNMRARAAEMKAELRVRSAPQQGTTVELIVRL